MLNGGFFIIDLIEDLLSLYFVYRRLRKMIYYINFNILNSI